MECFQIIKQIREVNGFTQNQIAGILNMSQTNYAKIENNRISISIDDLKTLCIFYNTSADYFLGLKTN